MLSRLGSLGNSLRVSLTPTMTAAASIKYITASQAQAIDVELMGPEGAFTLDQLMELAGLAIAEAVMKIRPLGEVKELDSNGMKQSRVNERVLVYCGSGNQGGDGFVAARHLHHFGYAPSIFYPKEGNNPHYARLKKQCENLGLPLIAPPLAESSLSSFPISPDAQINAFRRAVSSADIILDCLFGFSYKPPCRPNILPMLAELKRTDKFIISVDIPSGWDVEKGNIDDTFTPSALISLTCPKQGVEAFANSGGQHYLGGRFVPKEMEQEYQLNLPFFPGSSQCVDITLHSKL